MVNSRGRRASRTKGQVRGDGEGRTKVRGEGQEPCMDRYSCRLLHTRLTSLSSRPCQGLAYRGGDEIMPSFSLIFSGRYSTCGISPLLVRKLSAKCCSASALHLATRRAQSAPDISAARFRFRANRRSVTFCSTLMGHVGTHSQLAQSPCT